MEYHHFNSERLTFFQLMAMSMGMGAPLFLSIKRGECGLVFVHLCVCEVQQVLYYIIYIYIYIINNLNLIRESTSSPRQEKLGFWPAFVARTLTLRSQKSGDGLLLGC